MTVPDTGASSRVCDSCCCAFSSPTLALSTLASAEAMSAALEAWVVVLELDVTRGALLPDDPPLVFCRLVDELRRLFVERCERPPLEPLLGLAPVGLRLFGRRTAAVVTVEVDEPDAAAPWAEPVLPVD